MYVRQVLFLDRNLQSVRRGIHREPLTRNESRTAQRQDAFRREERRLNQYLGGVAYLVFFAVRDQFDLLLRQVALRRLFASGHPQSKFGLVRSFAVVVYSSGDAVAPAFARLEAALRGVRARFDHALLRIGLALLPFTLVICPVDQSGAHPDLAVGDGLAVEVGDD